MVNFKEKSQRADITKWFLAVDDLLQFLPVGACEVGLVCSFCPAFQIGFAEKRHWPNYTTASQISKSRGAVFLGTSRTIKVVIRAMSINFYMFYMGWRVFPEESKN